MTLNPVTVTNATVPVALDLLRRCSKLYPNLRNEVSRIPNSSQFAISSELLWYFEECEQIFQSLETWRFYLNTIACIIIVLGLILNSFVLLVLFLGDNKTSSDVYLMSIAIGDIIICVGTTISSQVMKYYPVLSVEVTGQIIGNLGEFFLPNPLY